MVKTLTDGKNRNLLNERTVNGPNVVGTPIGVHPEAVGVQGDISIVAGDCIFPNFGGLVVLLPAIKVSLQADACKLCSNQGLESGNILTICVYAANTVIRPNGAVKDIGGRSKDTISGFCRCARWLRSNNLCFARIYRNVGEILSKDGSNFAVVIYQVRVRNKRETV